MGDIEGREAAIGRQKGFQLLAISVLVLPLGVGALTFAIASLDTGVGGEPRIAESLIVKITYSPELAKYIGTWGNASSKTFPGEAEHIEEIGGYFKIEWLQSREEVRILVRNNTVGVFSEDELRGAVKIMNLTVENLSLKIVAGIWKIPLLDQTSVPSYVRRDALLLLKNQSFVKWLEKEGFGYTVTGVAPIEPQASLAEPTISGVLISLRVESLDVCYHLYFGEPYHLVVNASIPEELELSPYDKDNYGIYRICISEGTSEILMRPHPASRNITRPDSPFDMSRLNVTDEIREEVLAIMKEDRVLSRLLESVGCEVKGISGWVSENPLHRPEGIAANAILVCDEIEGYGVKVDIDLNAGKIEDVYLYTECTIATILSAYGEG